MQLRLPLFPKEATLISSFVGVYERDGLVQYIVNGLPVYTHPVNDQNSFHFITSNFIEQKLCLKSEVERCFQPQGSFLEATSYQLNTIVLKKSCKYILLPAASINFNHF